MRSQSWPYRTVIIAIRSYCQADASSVHMSLHDSVAILAVVTVDALANGTTIYLYVI